MTDQPPAAGWRDQPGGSELWTLILEAFGRAADSPLTTTIASKDG